MHVISTNWAQWVILYKKFAKEQKEKSRHGGTSLKSGYLVGGGSGVQSHLLVQSGFKASMGHSRHCLRQKQNGRHIHKSYLPLNSLQNINIKYSYSTMVRIIKSGLYSCCIYLLALGCSPSKWCFLYHSDLEDHQHISASQNNHEFLSYVSYLSTHTNPQHLQAKTTYTRVCSLHSGQLKLSHRVFTSPFPKLFLARLKCVRVWLTIKMEARSLQQDPVRRQFSNLWMNHTPGPYRSTSTNYPSRKGRGSQALPFISQMWLQIDFRRGRLLSLFVSPLLSSPDSNTQLQTQSHRQPG